MSDPSIQGPGWYYAEGDPPGTKRYWDGSTWTEGPKVMQDGDSGGMGAPIAGAAAGAAGAVTGAAGAAMGGAGAMASSAGGALSSPGSGFTPAPIGDRIIAYLIDSAIMIALFFVFFVVSLIGSFISDTLGTILLLLSLPIMFAAALYIFGWGQGETGVTPGKRTMGCKVVDSATGGMIGGGKGIGRWFVGGILNSVCGIPISSLWALIDKDNEALHDKVMKTRVVPGEKGGIMPLFPNGKPF